MQRAWRPVLLLGMLAIAGYFLIPSRAAQNVAFGAFGAACVALILVGVRVHRPERPGVWLLIAAGQALFVAGDFVWTVYEEFLHQDAPAFSAADLFYLGGYPFVAAGLVLLVRRRSPGQDRRSLIDATVVAVGIGLLAWAFLIRPYADDPTLAPVEQAVLISYPVMDVLLLAVAARLLVAPGVRVASYYFVVASLLGLFAADIAYVYGGLTEAFDFDTGSFVDAGWLLSYLCIAAAALHPSMARLSEPDPLPATRLTWARLTLLGAASLTAPAILGVQAARGEPLDVPVIVAGSVVLFLLVLLRMAGLFREVAATADELEFQGTALKATLRELQQAETERRRLLDRVLSGTDEERQRIAAELHDGPIQRLATVQLGLERARRHLERGQTETAAALFSDVTDQLSEETAGLRRLMAQLRPPALDESGLVGAVRDHVAGFERQTGVACQVQADVDVRLDPELETVLYRVIQEALTNVAKHARAHHVDVTLRSNNGTVELEVADDGIGFERARVGGLAREGHLGLVAMRERVQMAGGRWEVESVPDEGTRVHVTFEKAGAAG